MTAKICAIEAKLILPKFTQIKNFISFNNQITKRAITSKI